MAEIIESINNFSRKVNVLCPICSNPVEILLELPEGTDIDDIIEEYDLEGAAACKCGKPLLACLHVGEIREAS